MVEKVKIEIHIMSLLLGPFILFSSSELAEVNVCADDIYFGTKDDNLINEFDLFAVVSLNATH